MTFNFDTSELTQTAARRVTPHDNCIVTELSSGAFPRYIKVQLPDDDGPQQIALWDGSLDLEVNDEVLCHEYAEISIWRVMAMGGNDSGAGKQRVSKVWESDFENVVMSIDAAGLVTFQPAADSTTFLQVLDADGGAPVLNVDTTNERIGINLAGPSISLDISSGSQSGTMKFGGDVDAITRTDATRKLGRLVVPHYTNSEQNIACLLVDSKVSTTQLQFGGGAGALNTATVIQFFTAPDNITLLGTERMQIDSIGNIGMGAISPLTRLHIIDEDAVTAAITDIATLGHNSTGTPAANFGAGLLYQLESSTTINQDAARIAALWTEPTHAILASELVFETRTAGGSLTRQMRIAGNGVITSVSGRKKKHTLIGNTDSPYTVLETDEIIFVDTDTAAVTVNLPAGAGQHYRIVNTGSSANDVTVDPNGTEQLYSGGAGVSFALIDAEIINIYFETTKGWW